LLGEPSDRLFRGRRLARSLGLSATSQQYFSLRMNQPPATSQQYSSLGTNQHQPSANRTGCGLLGSREGRRVRERMTSATNVGGDRLIRLPSHGLRGCLDPFSQLTRV
jgi:hypothetical protein